LLARDDVAAEIAEHYGDRAKIVGALPLDQCQSKLDTIENGLILALVHQGQEMIMLKGCVVVEQGHWLKLTQARWCLPTHEAVFSEALTDFRWDLGEQVELETLTLEDDGLTCQCRIMVQP
ncbi:MAG: hypothetical protein AAFY17_18125, partial [Cyanobacteria bacterium J06642_11]